MKRWNKTTITWHMWGTDVHERDRAVTTIRLCDQGKHLEAPLVCIIIKAVSDLERTVRLRIRFDLAYRWLGDGDLNIIQSRIETIKPHTQFVSFEITDSNEVTLILKLGPGEHFCERSLEFIDQLFTVLGIEDFRQRIRGNFDIEQETFVMEDDGEWQSYSDWLRGKFHFGHPYVFGWTN